MKKKNEGITLIALIITIIILLILVGVSITMVVNEDIFGKASESKDKIDTKVAQQQGIIDNIVGQRENFDVPSEEKSGETDVPSDEESGAASSQPLLASKVSVGDYVAYDATSTHNYTSFKSDYYINIYGRWSRKIFDRRKRICRSNTNSG